jgi:predicted amidohydrolase
MPESAVRPAAGMRPILLQNGRLIDPSAGRDEVTDLLLSDGVVLSVGRGLSAPEGTDVRDVSGLVVCPGLIDLQRDAEHRPARR